MAHGVGNPYILRVHSEDKMEQLFNIGIFLIFVVTLTDLVSGMDDVPEFQYPCFVDVCTFPRQYCNSDRHERRCSPCSPSICREVRKPTACKYICMKYVEPSITTPKPATEAQTYKSKDNDNENTQMFSLQLIMIYCAVTTTLIAILIIVIISICFIQQCNTIKTHKRLTVGGQTSFKSIQQDDGQDIEATVLQPAANNLVQNQRYVNIPGPDPPSYKSSYNGEEQSPLTTDCEENVEASTEDTNIRESSDRTSPLLQQVNPTPDANLEQHHMPWRNNRTQNKQKTSTGCQAEYPEEQTFLKGSIVDETTKNSRKN